ncbi:hypothetical protein OSB04_022882 [Centaurea solstitialis]|uniref:Uncharacterized protein n=1 Tax=Centaurea solstitialis TaxID=347529 RepID=A0AA38SVI5_9ASTR|nr:hypothetical protein OSB04_022882 [Centaurea solstitialis]
MLPSTWRFPLCGGWCLIECVKVHELNYEVVKGLQNNLPTCLRGFVHIWMKPANKWTLSLIAICYQMDSNSNRWDIPQHPMPFVRWNVNEGRQKTRGQKLEEFREKKKATLHCHYVIMVMETCTRSDYYVSIYAMLIEVDLQRLHKGLVAPRGL